MPYSTKSILTLSFFNLLLILSNFKLINNKNLLGLDDIDMTNWMSRLPDDKKIVLINLAGTHDSAAFDMYNPALDKLAQCQFFSITEQLNIGIRRFDIRATEKSNDLICCHGVLDCYYEDEQKTKKMLQYKHVVEEVKNFLEQYPTETVFFSTSSGRGVQYTNIKWATEIFEEIIPKKMRVKYDRDLTLGELRGKIIYDFYKTDQIDKDGKPVYNSGIEGGKGIWEIHQKYESYETFKVDGALKVQELKDLFEIYDNVSFEDAEIDFAKNPLNYPLRYSISCTGEKKNTIPLPRVMAETVNPFVLNYDLKRGHYYGWINMDFAEINIAKKIIETNF